MNGSAPSTPASSSATARKPQTLKKRRPSEPVSVNSPGRDTSSQSHGGPTALRRMRANSRREDRNKHFLKRLVKYELPRKALHSSIGFLGLYLYVTHADVYILVKYLFRTLVVITSVDVLRFASRRFERTYERVLGFLMRESEKTSWNGTIWYLVGCIFVLSTLPRDLAVISVLLLSWCDTSASVFGRKFGKYTPKLPCPPFASGKSLAGTLAAFAFGALSARVFYTYAAPLGSEQDLSWLGPIPSYVPAWLQRYHQTTYTGRPTGFPEYIRVGKGARISTRLPQPQSTLHLWQVELICAFAAALAEGIDVYGFDDNATLPVISGLMIWGAMYILG